MLFDLRSLPEKECYKLLAGIVVPRPIAWVVTTDRAGRPNAAPFSFFNVLSSDPPVVGFGVGRREGGKAKDTADNIQARGQFVVCVVSEETALAMNVTAVDFPPGTDELDLACLATAPSALVAPPRIGESPAALECERFQTIDLGAYELILGRVLAIHVRDDCVLDAERNYLDTAKLRVIGRMEPPAAYIRCSDRFGMPRSTATEWRDRQEGRAANAGDRVP
jgi:flavin reductase (DIM6/NTAB) family NADH-FMN oxidoreductase RutF